MFVQVYLQFNLGDMMPLKVEIAKNLSGSLQFFQGFDKIWWHKF